MMALPAEMFDPAVVGSELRVAQEHIEAHPEWLAT